MKNEIVLSSITVIEVEHGLHRANAPELIQKGRDYLNTIFAAIPVEPFTREMAQLAAKIDAENEKGWKRHSVCRLADRCYRTSLRLRNWDSQPAALSNDPWFEGCFALALIRDPQAGEPLQSFFEPKQLQLDILHREWRSTVAHTIQLHIELPRFFVV